MTRRNYTPEEFMQLSDEEQWAIRLEGELDDIQDYLRTGEIRSHLSMKAAMAVHDASHGWTRIREDVTAFEQQWIEVYALVYADVTAIQFAAKEFEFKHWMGFCDEDVAELVQDYKRWTYFDWKRSSKEEGDAMRDKWNPHQTDLNDRDYWRRYWQPYIDRRDKRPLQEIYKESPTFLSNRNNILDRMAVAVGAREAAAFVDKHLKVAMGSSAGRVLLTISDQIPRNDPENKFDGAHITLIFDETAGWPRGGVQGQAATREEAIGMLKAISDSMPMLMSDTNLRIF